MSLPLVLQLQLEELSHEIFVKTSLTFFFFLRVHSEEKEEARLIVGFHPQFWVFSISQRLLCLYKRSILGVPCSACLRLRLHLLCKWSPASCHKNFMPSLASHSAPQGSGRMKSPSPFPHPLLFGSFGGRRVAPEAVPQCDAADDQQIRRRGVR